MIANVINCPRQIRYQPWKDGFLSLCPLVNLQIFILNPDDEKRNFRFSFTRYKQCSKPYGAEIDLDIVLDSVCLGMALSYIFIF